MKTFVFLGIFYFFTLTGCSMSVMEKFSPGDRDAQDAPDVQYDVPYDDDGSPPCPGGMTLCGEICVNLQTDSSNCGDCGNACPAGMTCNGGTCVCSAGLTDCGGVCVNTAADPQNCGTCGNACGEGLVCNEGTCSLSCSGGLTNCDGACVNTQMDPNHCGGCNNACAAAEGAYAVCVDGGCALECQPNRWDIDGLPGCEYFCTFASDTERCNGQDDNCDGIIDEGFECIRGLARSCTTVCGTGGMQQCSTDTCTWERCCAAAETCGNNCDDDCNELIDDGCSTSPPNDTCDNPLDVTDGGRFTGSTADAADNSTGGCARARTGRDVYFSFTVTESSDVFISTYGSAFDTVLYVSTTCGDSEAACTDDMHAPEVMQSHVSLHDLGPGIYYIALDGNGPGRSGDYVLDFYMNPADDPGDTCGHALPFNPGGVDGYTCDLDAFHTGSCSYSGVQPVPPPEAVYFFVVPNEADIHRITFSSCHDHTDYDTLIYIRSVCSDPSSEEACIDDTSPPACEDSWKSIVGADLGPGVYYLFVDGWCSPGSCDYYCGNYLVTATGP